MKRFLISFIILFLVILIYVYHILSSTGFFRKVENKDFGTIYKEIPIMGAEDIAISREDSFMIVSATDRRGLKAGKSIEAGLFYIDLRDDSFSLVPISSGFNKPFHPLGISMWKIDSISYKVYVVNDPPDGPSLEVFNFSTGELTHLQTLTDPLMVDPNDVVAVGEDKLYITNDHGFTSKAGVFFENYMGLKVCTVIYFNGDSFKIATDGIGYANGINYNVANSKVYVASSRTFTIKEYSIEEDGILSPSRDIDVGSGPDNIEFDSNGSIYVACHPNLLAFTSYAALKKDISPSEIVRVDPGDPAVIESLYVNEGETISASSVAVPFGDYLFIGSVMDDALLILKIN